MLLGDVQAHMIKEASKPNGRRQDIIHPSEVAKTGWCPKSTWLRIERCRALGDPYWKLSETHGVQLLNIFDEGHYIHDKWQKRLREMGLLWGYWYCRVCGHRFQATSPYECPRDKCMLNVESPGWAGRKDFLVYKEIPLRDDSLKIAGHADGGVPSKKALIEIKSVGTGTARIEAPDIFKANSDGQKIDLPGLWRDIKEPFPAHVRQGQLYLYLCSVMGLDFDKIVFLYESKFNQGAKEFVVKYDFEAIAPVIAQIKDIVQALNGGSPVSCPFGGCKDCEVYGEQEFSTSERLGDTPEQVPTEGTESPGETGGRSPRVTKRIVRPS